MLFATRLLHIVIAVDFSRVARKKEDQEEEKEDVLVPQVDKTYGLSFEIITIKN
jgi:hypothetical protein